MSDENKPVDPQNRPFDWVDKTFSRSDDVDPKYRDMLAMIAMLMMGNRDAAQHYFAKSIVDGASDEELRRMVNTAKSVNLDIGDLVENVKNALEAMKREQADADDTNSAPPSVN